MKTHIETCCRLIAFAGVGLEKAAMGALLRPRGAIRFFLSAHRIYQIVRPTEHLESWLAEGGDWLEGITGVWYTD